MTELYRNRTDRFEPLIQFMRKKRVDLDLLRRGMSERGIPQERQDQVTSQLNAVS